VLFLVAGQTGDDSDEPMATGEVGKVGVPISHITDMEALFAEIPPAKINPSMTISATAAWLLASDILHADYPQSRSTASARIPSVELPAQFVLHMGHLRRK
jgi:methylmalonyl-CoA mutase N-terminal domain/subunit